MATLFGVISNSPKMALKIRIKVFFYFFFLCLALQDGVPFQAMISGVPVKTNEEVVLEIFFASLLTRRESSVLGKEGK